MENKNSSEIGKAIKAARRAKNETQSFMGAKLGASQQLVSSWEKGRRAVPKVYRRALTKNYGVKFEEPKKQAVVMEQPERQLQTPDRRAVVRYAEQEFVGELREILEGVAGVLVVMVRKRRGRLVRRARP